MLMPMFRGAVGLPRLLGATLCSLLFVHDALAVPGPEPLTLEGLLTALAERNPTLRGRRAEVRAAQERPAQARAFEDPMIMAEVWQAPVSGGPVPLMFTLRQPIPWPGKLRARGAALEPAVHRAAAEVGAAARELRLEAIRMYYEYRLALRSIAVLQQNRELLSTVLQSVDVRYRVGRAELAELLKAREELANLENSLLDLERQRDLATTALNRLLDRPADEPLGPPATEPALRPVPDLAALTEQALQQRPEVRAVEATLQQALAQVRAARSERAPDLAAWVGFMAMLGGTEHTYTIGLQTSLPSFSLQRSSAAAREALAQGEAARAALRATQAQVRAEVREALLRLETASRHVRLHEDTLLPLSEQEVRAAQASYQSGRVNFVLFLDAARSLLTHRLEYERFVADYGQRLGEVEAAIGGSVPVAAPRVGPQGGVP